MEETKTQEREPRKKIHIKKDHVLKAALILGALIIVVYLFGCFYYHNRFMSHTTINDIGKNGVTLPFTEDSYDMSKCERIFTRVGQRNRQYISLILNETDRIFKKADPNRYVPFCHNWICSCWIVRIDGKVYAKFNKILTLVGHDYNVKHLIDKEDI